MMKLRNISFLFVLFPILWIQLTTHRVIGARKLKVFQNPKDAFKNPFQRMVVERVYTGCVYLGGVNHLYQLRADLTLENKVDTGPIYDLPDCQSKSGCKQVEKVPINNYNKALTIYSSSSTNKLIACGSIRQGLCRLHDLYNITKIDPEISIPVVANDKESSSVIFVAPGPVNNDALYVASTYTDLGQNNIRDKVPAVATLSLQYDSLFEVAHNTNYSETQIFVEHSKRTNYKIDYVYGFSSGNYSYFLTRQQTTSIQDSAYQSKLVQLCQKDKHYYSYTEIPLQCKNVVDGDFNLVQAAYIGKPGKNLAANLSINTEADVLFAVFVKGEGIPFRNNPSQSSALCAYSLKSIEAKFAENIKLCAQGEINKELEFIKKDILCSKMVHSLDTSCGSDINYPLGGNLSITQEPAYIIRKSARLTSVVSTTTPMYTVVFMGTEDGQLKKVTLETSSEANEYDSVDLEVGSSPIIDLQLDTSGEYIYVLTASSVSKVKRYECDQYQKCTTCLAAKDPYCGWCLSQTKCITTYSCDPTLWISHKVAQCATITKVIPDKIPITQTQFLLNLEIQNLPAFNGQLYCVFTLVGKNLTTKAQKGTANNIINCTTPHTSSLPQIPAGFDSLAALLSVQIDNVADIATTNFTFFDCSSYKSCTDCTSSSFLCDWCIETSICVERSAVEVKCRELHLITNQNQQHPSSHRGLPFCPGIIPVDEPEIFLPSHTSKEIIVKAINLLDFQSNFTCIFDINGRTVDRKANKLNNDTIKCESIEFSYSDSLAKLTAKMSVLWSKGEIRGHMLDNPQNIRINMYKCEHLAPNCDLCLSLNATYECGWCSNKASCTLQSKCKMANQFLDHSAICPDPTISSFSPESGPIDGGTLLTINGINLGRSFEDIKSNIRVNDIPCTPIESLYKVSTQIVCKTGAALKSSLGSVVIEIRGDRKYTAKSPYTFKFVNPVIKGFEPLYGQQSGGTLITIDGDHLDAGSNISVSIGGVPCAIIKSNEHRVQCRTGTSKTWNKPGGVTMQFDSALINFVNYNFTYDLDPQIKILSRYKSLASGGLNLDVQGLRFLLIQEPKFFLRYNDKEYSSVCKVETNEKMKCLTPKVDPIDDDVMDSNQSVRYDYGFLFDGVNFDSQLNFIYPKEPFFVFPDPILERFSENEGRPMKYFNENFDHYLTVNGNNLDSAIVQDDVKVFIGTDICNITIWSKIMACKPPSKPPFSSRNFQPEVLIVFGDGSYNFSLGYLSYESPAIAETDFPLSTIAVIVFIFLIGFSITLIVILFHYCRKSFHLQFQRETSENKIDAVELKAIIRKSVDRIKKTSIVERSRFEVVIPDGSTNGHNHGLLKYVSDIIAELQPPSIDDTEVIKDGFKVSRMEKYNIFLNIERVIKDILPTLSNSDYCINALIASIKLFISSKESYTVDNLSPIGRGNFGEVYRGTLSYSCSSDTHKRDVALKVPIEEDEDGTYCLKIEWILLLYIGKHDNIVSFVEAITKPSLLGKFTLITEFCELGDLMHYIAEHRKSFKISSSQNQRRLFNELEELLKNNILCLSALFMYAAQIANGFYFLAQRNILHRDLSLQNLLLTIAHIVKINDFGLGVWGRRYQAKHRTSFQLHRLPPESRLEFTEKTDVWSFGILLTELFSLGTNLEFSKFNEEFETWFLSDNGYEVPIHHAIHKLTNLIMNCGNIRPKARPTFCDCRKILLEALNEQSEDMFLYIKEKVMSVKNI